MAAGRDVPHDLTQFVIERALESGRLGAACARRLVRERTGATADGPGGRVRAPCCVMAVESVVRTTLPRVAARRSNAGGAGARRHAASLAGAG